jgi:hypothetical protein
MWRMSYQGKRKQLVLITSVTDIVIITVTGTLSLLLLLLVITFMQVI